MNYKDFLSNNSSINSNINDENKKVKDEKKKINKNTNSDKNIINMNTTENNNLIDELNKYRKENEELKNKINLLLNKNLKLENDLAKANKAISNLSSNNQQNDNITNLKEIIKSKDIEINNLKLQLQNNKKTPVNLEDIIAIQFISTDQRISYPIKCLKTETFAEVEEKLYQKYEEYREKNNNFIAKGRLILRFKKICENQIEDGDKIQLLVE